MDEVLSLRGSLRRGPWSGGDLNDVFAQRSEIATIPGGVAQDIGETPESARERLSGVRNGDFGAAPPDVASDINDITNKLADWSFVQSAGTSITARVVTDANAASGYVLRFSCASGNINDLSYIEQTVPISSSRGGTWAAVSRVHWLAASAGTATFEYVANASYLKADGTATGTEITGSGPAFVTAVKEQTLLPGVSGTVPSDARYLRIRFGVKRTATNATTATLDMADVYVATGGDRILFPDQTTSTNPPGSIIKSANVVTLNHDQQGIKPSVVLDGDDDTVEIRGELIGARVRRTATQAIADAVDESIRFTATDSIDTLAMHTANSELITIVKSGVYALGGGATFASNSTGNRAMYVELNGADAAGTLIPGTYTKIRAADGSASALNCTTIVSLTATDTLSLTVVQNSGGDLDISDATFWCYQIVNP